MENAVQAKKIQFVGYQISKKMNRLYGICNTLNSNASKLKESIDKANGYRGKRSTHDKDIKKYVTTTYTPTETIMSGGNPSSQINFESVKKGDAKHTVNYRVWDYKEITTNSLERLISYTNELKEELSSVLGYGDEINLSGEELEKIGNEELKIAGEDSGDTLLDETDARFCSGESGDRVLNGDETNGITDENQQYYRNLAPGEWFSIRAGTGVEAGTYAIIKHTADGQETTMKWISESTARQWIKKVQEKNKENKKKAGEKVLKGLAAAGAGIIGLGTKLNNALNDKVKDMQSSSTADTPKTIDLNGESYDLDHVRTVDGKSLDTFVDKNGNTYNVTSEKVNNEWKQVGNIKPIKDYGNTFGPNPPQIEKARADGMKRTQTVIEQQANTNKYTHFEGTSISSGTGKTITPIDTSPNNPLTTALDSHEDINVPTGKVEINGTSRIGLGGSTLKYDNENGNWGIDLGNGKLSDERFTKADIYSSQQIKNSYNN